MSLLFITKAKGCVISSIFLTWSLIRAADEHSAASVWIEHFLFCGSPEPKKITASVCTRAKTLSLIALSPLSPSSPHYFNLNCTSTPPPTRPPVHPSSLLGFSFSSLRHATLPTLYLYSKGSRGSLASVPAVLFKHLPHPVPGPVRDAGKEKN